MKTIRVLTTLIIFSAGNILAQDTLQTALAQNRDSSKSFLRNFFITGNGYVNLEKTNEEESPVVHGAVYPILLWQISDKLFFESSEEIALEDDEVKASVEFATLHYELNKYITIGAGKFLTPSGTFRERLHPGWINKFPEAPLGFSHEGGTAGSMSEIGLEARGGAPLGSSKINYAFYVSNGPTISTDSNETPMPGMLENGELKDNNNNKAVGGRIGFLPFANSSLEIGIAKQFAKVGDRNDSLYKDAIAATYAFDLSYVANVPSLKSMIDIKGEFNYAMVDQSGKSSSVDMDSMSNLSAMTNVTRAYYIQFAIRPAMFQKKIIQNLELAARYSVFDMSEEGMDGINNAQFSVGLNYWLSWRSVIKFAYMAVKEDDQSESFFLLQLALAHPKIKFKRKNKE